MSGICDSVELDRECLTATFMVAEVLVSSVYFCRKMYLRMKVGVKRAMEKVRRRDRKKF